MVLFFEKILNLIIGTIVLTNLYYLSPLIGLERLDVILILLVVSLIFYLIRFNKKSLFLSNHKLVLSIVTLSSFFLIINSAFNNYTFYPNDIIRILIYLFYFNWTFFLYQNNSIKYRVYITKLLELIFICIILMSLAEYFIPTVFRSLIFDNYIDYENSIRLAVTFRDPNSFATSLCIFLFIYLRLKGLTLKSTFLTIIVLFIVNLSGSRLGLLLLLFVLFDVLKYHINVKKMIAISAILFFSIFGYNQIIKYKITEVKTETIFERVFDQGKSYASSSSLDQRFDSYTAALDAISISNMILPPGNFLFKSKWKEEINKRHYPHSSFLYMLVEYGVFFIWPLIIILKLRDKSKKSKLNNLYYMLIILLLILPNIIYYSIVFFIINHIEHEYCNNFTISKK